MIHTQGYMWPAEQRPSSKGGRDPAFEREFLNQAQRLAGADSGWAEAVQDRLHRMEREKGQDSFLQLTLDRLLSEIDEEGLDVGGWAMVSAEAAWDKIDDDERRADVQLRLQRVARFGPLIREEVRQIRDLLR